jgi:phosphatidylserine/phosphatidylglycerophosphate/cardiolipin synthase-like enzyme
MWLHTHHRAADAEEGSRLRNLRKVHHKLMVIDNRIVIAGTFNHTAPANEYNDKNESRRSSYDPFGSVACAIPAGSPGSFSTTQYSRCFETTLSVSTVS